MTKKSSSSRSGGGGGLDGDVIKSFRLQAGAFLFCNLMLMVFFIQMQAPLMTKQLQSNRCSSSSSNEKKTDDAVNDDNQSSSISMMSQKQVHQLIEAVQNSSAHTCTKMLCQAKYPSPATATTTTTPVVLQQQPAACTADVCRKTVFVNRGGGGLGVLSKEHVEGVCRHPWLYKVCDDLRDFTGLSEQELMDRLQRVDNFHFEGEHLFWNPRSKTELAWYYSTSVNYLFANSMHGAAKGQLANLKKGINEPVLDYSGGVGNNVMALAEQGMKSIYFGIGQMEKNFAEYRFRKRGYIDSGLVKVVSPWETESNWKFDPTNKAVLPRDGSLGAILAIDVLEHIPNYHLVVEAMVDSLKVGGYIFEQSPFSGKQNNGAEDLRVHVSNGGVSMAQAMGPRMNMTASGGWGTHWKKISENSNNPQEEASSSVQ